MGYTFIFLCLFMSPTIISSPLSFVFFCCLSFSCLFLLYLKTQFYPGETQGLHIYLSLLVTYYNLFSVVFAFYLFFCFCFCFSFHFILFLFSVSFISLDFDHSLDFDLSLSIPISLSRFRSLSLFSPINRRNKLLLMMRDFYTATHIYTDAKFFLFYKLG